MTSASILEILAYGLSTPNRDPKTIITLTTGNFEEFKGAVQDKIRELEIRRDYGGIHIHKSKCSENGTPLDSKHVFSFPCRKGVPKKG
ncbi:hypothetical protein [Thermogymnomonas acidicola]|uniref:hypothetical protein n=1 Tax=Thermogymnomonas acidicola TaxID=399579 RepID=UPI00166ED1C3|nr:hypothetical protein [Thermogymnomonas acidicola]